jgi:hypothetical protein
MEAVFSSETSVDFKQATQLYILEHIPLLKYLVFKNKKLKNPLFTDEIS